MKDYHFNQGARASGSWDYVIKLARDYETIVTDIAFSPDGQLMVITSEASEGVEWRVWA